MNRFAFSLGRVLVVRRLQASVERARLQEAEARAAAIEEERAALAHDARAGAEALARPGAQSPAHLLQAAERFAGFAIEEDRRLSRASEALHTAAAHQRLALQEAERRCQLLEKLETREKNAWEKAVAKELDELAADVFLSRLARETR
jgi:hypothetical protein